MNTIPGGLYLLSDGKTYVNANGEVIHPTKEQLAAYRALHEAWETKNKALPSKVSEKLAEG